MCHLLTDCDLVRAKQTHVDSLVFPRMISNEALAHQRQANDQVFELTVPWNALTTSSGQGEPKSIEVYMYSFNCLCHPNQTRSVRQMPKGPTGSTTDHKWLLTMIWIVIKTRKTTPVAYAIVTFCPKFRFCERICYNVGVSPVFWLQLNPWTV